MTYSYTPSQANGTPGITQDAGGGSNLPQRLVVRSGAYSTTMRIRRCTSKSLVSSLVPTLPDIPSHANLARSFLLRVPPQEFPGNGGRGEPVLSAEDSRRSRSAPQLHCLCCQVETIYLEIVLGVIVEKVDEL